MGHGGYARHTDPVPASTEQDYMEINMALPRENLELFFRLEADRMANAILRGWEAQRFTVLEQILGGRGRPQTRFNEAIDAVTAAAHPVYRPDGGHIRDFGNFTRAAHLKIYDDYFVPNNAALVLVGDITMAEAVPLAERYFGVPSPRPTWISRRSRCRAGRSDSTGPSRSRRRCTCATAFPVWDTPTGPSSI